MGKYNGSADDLALDHNGVASVCSAFDGLCFETGLSQASGTGIQSVFLVQSVCLVAKTEPVFLNLAVFFTITD